jgi:putative transcriptional regulator
MGRKLKNRLDYLIIEKQRKEKKRIKLSEIAEAIDVRNNTITNWLKNDQQKLDIAVVERLCDYFECDLSDLLYFEIVNEDESNYSG